MTEGKPNSRETLYSCVEAYRKILIVLFLISSIIYSSSGTPTIEGPSIVYVSMNQNLSIDCRSENSFNTSITWYKIEVGDDLLEDPNNEDLIRFYIKKAKHLEIFGDTEYTASTDKFTATMEFSSVTPNDEGMYVCIYEFSKSKVKRKLRKFDLSHFSWILLLMNASSPAIKEGNEIIAEAGNDVNITCTGNEPVSWVALNNNTQAVQHTDTKGNVHFSILELQHVNYTDVGYYVCVFNKSNTILYDDHKHKQDRMVRTYLYVKDLDHLLSMEEDLHTLYSEVNKQLIVPCKPTFPDVKVQLQNRNFYKNNAEKVNDPRKGFIIDSELHDEGLWLCKAEFENILQKKFIQIEILYRTNIPPPSVRVSGYWQKDPFEAAMETYVAVSDGPPQLLILCSAVHELKYGEKLAWEIPKTANSTGDQYVYRTEKQQVRNFSHLSSDDEGIYSCFVKFGDFVNSSMANIALKVLPNEPYLVMKAQNNLINKTDNGDISWFVHFNAYPKLNLHLSFQGKSIVKLELEESENITSYDDKKYNIGVNWKEGKIKFHIRNADLSDVGQYTLTGRIANLTVEVNLVFLIKGKPENTEVQIIPRHTLMHSGMDIIIECISYGYPVPQLELQYKPFCMNTSCNLDFMNIEFIKANNESRTDQIKSEYLAAKGIIKWQGIASKQGQYRCISNNRFGQDISPSIHFSISDSDLHS